MYLYNIIHTVQPILGLLATKYICPDQQMLINSHDWQPQINIITHLFVYIS